MILYKLARKRWKQVDSTFITEVAYDSGLYMLSLRLKGGKVYNFKDVTKDIYKDFLKSTSKGRFFNNMVKDNYEWNKESE